MKIHYRLTTKCLEVCRIVGLRNRSKFNLEIKRHGSQYGGWFAQVNSYEPHIIVTGGVGEDISFEVEVSSIQPDCLFVFIDPTSRALTHFQKTLLRSGMSAELDYSSDGEQDVRSYNLKYFKEQRVFFINKALWKDCAGLMLERPKQSEHVSFKKPSSTSTDIEWFESTDLPTVLNNLNTWAPRWKSQKIILKMDIEGSELVVLNSFLQGKWRPYQLLVEFDILRNGSLKAVIDWLLTLLRLRLQRYRIVNSEGFNVTFMRIKNR